MDSILTTGLYFYIRRPQSILNRLESLNLMTLSGFLIVVRVSFSPLMYRLPSTRLTTSCKLDVSQCLGSTLSQVKVTYQSILYSILDRLIPYYLLFLQEEGSLNTIKRLQVPTRGLRSPSSTPISVHTSWVPHLLLFGPVSTTLHSDHSS